MTFLLAGLLALWISSFFHPFLHCCLNFFSNSLFFILDLLLPSAAIFQPKFKFPPIHLRFIPSSVLLRRRGFCFPISHGLRNDFLFGLFPLRVLSLIFLCALVLISLHSLDFISLGILVLIALHITVLTTLIVLVWHSLIVSFLLLFSFSLRFDLLFNFLPLFVRGPLVVLPSIEFTLNSQD